MKKLQTTQLVSIIGGGEDVPLPYYHEFERLRWFLSMI